MKSPTTPEDQLRWLFTRIPDACLIETDPSGRFTRFGPDAEAFFRCPASDALAKLHYPDFHDPEQMQACNDDPDFMRIIKQQGWIESDWRVIPRSGAPFLARVTLLPLFSLETDVAKGENARRGWLALYRRIGD